MSYLVDADWLIDAAIGRPRAQRALDRLSVEGLAVSIIAVAEIYEGAFGTPDPQATLAGLRDFLSDFATLPLTDPIVDTLRGCAPRCDNRVSSFPTWICSSPPRQWKRILP